MTTTDTVTRTFPLSGPINLDCRLGFGSVVVRAHDDVSEAIVALTPRTPGSDIADRTIAEMRGRTLTVRSPKPKFLEHDALDVEMTVPSGTALKMSTYGADITVIGRSGGADVASGATSIELDQVDGDLRLRYGSGPARVHRVTGAAVVKSGSGNVTFGEAGQVTMACGTGDLTIDVAHGRVHMRAGTGQVHIGAAEDDVDLVSGSGGLAVGLRPGQTARLDVTTGAGRLHSDLPVEDAAPATGQPITIRARTGSGDVRLFRADQASSPDNAA